MNLIPDESERSIRDCGYCIFEQSVDGYGNGECTNNKCAEIYRTRRREFKHRSIYNDDFNNIPKDFPCNYNLSPNEIISMLENLK